MDDVQPDSLLSITVCSIKEPGEYIVAHYPFDDSDPYNLSMLDQFPQIVENLHWSLNCGLLTQHHLLNQDILELQVGEIKYMASPICTGSFNSTEDNSYILFLLSTFNNADIQTLKFYNSLLRRFGLILRNDEKLLNSISREVVQLAKLYKNEADPTTFNLQKLIGHLDTKRSQSTLVARICKRLFLQLREGAGVDIDLGGGSGIHVSLADHQLIPSPLSFDFIVQNIRPYHSLVFRDMKLIPPEFGEFVRSHSSRVCLSQSALDIGWDKVRYMSAYLVYWGRASVIFPIDGTSIYKTTSNFGAIQSGINMIQSRFSHRFPQHSLFWALNKIVPGLSLSQILDIHPDLCQDKICEIIEWLITNDILEQLHHYFYQLPGDDFFDLSPYFRGHHHVEEITYQSQIKRTTLFALIHKHRHNIAVELRTDFICQKLKFNYL